ncbi:flagellar export chaperone FliS [Roseimaritima sediminicola]|uniref:flagellar export chaperone FliS n=1 Tax=Roseimaritima sediminicola TaxID=2662066 RepID=UPI0012985837|nr:flagellar export chaperone FliS [Roseimaritima sediminicola]
MSRTHHSQQYLEQSVLNATPARLRLMLIERGVQVAQSLAAMPADQIDQVAFTDMTLRLRDILGELLSGVKQGDLEVAKQVADLYVFLLQHLTAAEQQHDPATWSEIATVLEIERETWQLACGQNAVPAPHQTLLSGLNSSAAGLNSGATPGGLATGNRGPSATAPRTSSLNLQG